MKKLLLCSLLLLPCLAVMAEDTSSGASGAAAAASAPSDPRTGAQDIVKMFVPIYKSGSATSEQWDAVSAKIAGYQKQYGVSPETTQILVQLRGIQLTVAKKIDQARYNALVQTLSTDPIPEVAAMAQEKIATQKKLDDLKAKPVDLQFTAVDGTKINLADMRGKVVLLDFWATWCPPCREEVPDVVAAYKQYHDKGFEVIGISLDQDKDKLLAFTKENGMVWPQYFDGLGWDNNISHSFGINSIPAMWLIDKKGMLVTDDGRDDLAGQVAKLLATP